MRRVKPETKRFSFVEKDLGGSDDHAFDRSVEDNLTGDGIEGHLVVRFVLVEVVLGWGCGGGLVVHHKELIVEGDNSVHVAAEEEGCGFSRRWPSVNQAQTESSTHTAGFPSDLM